MLWAHSPSRKRALLSSPSKTIRKQTLVDALKAEMFPPASEQESSTRLWKQSLSPTSKQVVIDPRTQTNSLRRKPIRHRKIVPECIPHADPKRPEYHLNVGRPYSHSEARLHTAISPKRLTIIQIEIQPNDPPPRRTYSRALSRLKPQRQHFLYCCGEGDRKHATAETNTEEVEFPSAPPIARVNFCFAEDDLEYPFQSSRRTCQKFSQKHLH